MGDRLAQAPLASQRNAEVVVRLREVRLEGEGAAVTGDRFVQPPGLMVPDGVSERL